MKWIRNTRGNPDALLTFALFSVAVVLLKVLTNGASFGRFSAGTVDATLVGAVLVPTLGAYTTKRVAGTRDEKKP